MRWHHPKRGLLLPGEFIPRRERSPLIASFTAQILRRACAQVASWRSRECPTSSSPSTSPPTSSATPRWSTVWSPLSSRAAFRADALWLEVTETALARPTGIERFDGLDRLCALGVRIALDDFGIGFASLGQLRRFPVHTLKIDRVFVDGVVRGGWRPRHRPVRPRPRPGAGLSVIAEGVETEVQRRRSRRWAAGCFRATSSPGPAFADPPPAWLHAGRRVAAVAPAGR